MKKKLWIKIPIILLLSVFALICLLLSVFFIMTAGLKIDEEKLVNVENGYEYYDSCGELFAEEYAGNSVTSGDKIPDHVKNAFIAIEDKRFYNHKGIDFKAVLRSVVNNVKNRSFKEGGSTITQQLVKNTHLSGEKTFKRKISEMRLALELEKKYDKKEILEKYLNTIYFGCGAYGIADASKTYFEKSPEELSVNEAAVLAAVVKAPSQYSPVTHRDKCETRKNLVLKEMLAQNYIEKSEYEKCLGSFPTIKIENLQKNDFYDYSYLVKNEISSLSEDENFSYYGKKRKIYTSLEKENQQILETAIKNGDDNCEKTTVLLSRDGKIAAYASTTYEQKRQAGSVLKPLLVYAPAIETGTVYGISPILDEKTDFGGYTPSNYNDKYGGYISVKESLARSSNVCATKILNYTGIEHSKKYLAKTNIELTENDNSLCIALGCTENGVFLKDLAAVYAAFTNKGVYNSPTTLASKNSITFPAKNTTESKIFSEGTCDVLNDMLRYTVTNGTAKKLSFLNFPVYAKTGTVGTKNGNTDAYCISYTSEYVLGVWCGNKNGDYMNNSVSGGTLPAETASEIWSQIYKNGTPKEIAKSSESVELNVDKISYDKDKTVILADDNAPERFVLRGLFAKNNLPVLKSERFSHPRIEKCVLSVNNSEICIQLCLTELCGADIYRTDEGGKKELVYAIKEAGDKEVCFIDDSVTKGKVYSYSVVPYYKKDAKIFYGEGTLIGKIKTPLGGGVENWWLDEFG